jgi:hypothetical protein
MTTVTILVTERNGKFGIGIRGIRQQDPMFTTIERASQVWAWFEDRAEYDTQLAGLKALYNKPHRNSRCQVARVNDLGIVGKPQLVA